MKSIMKIIRKSSIILGMFLSVCYYMPLCAENGPISEANEQLRHIFGQIQHPTNFLYDRASHVIDDTYYDTLCTLPTNYSTWYFAYEEMFNAAKNQLAMYTPSQIADIAYGYNHDTIAIGIMDFEYSQLKENVLNSNTYFDFDTINGILSRGFRTNNPYDIKEIFMSAPLVESTHTTNPVFYYDYSLLFENCGLSEGTLNGQSFDMFVDFGDGTGDHLIQMDHSPMYIAIQYASSGEYQITTKIYQICNNERLLIRSSISKIIVDDNPSTDLLDNYDVTCEQLTNWENDGMRVFEFTSNCDYNPDEEKIIFVLSGYNPTSFQNYFKRDPVDLYQKYIIEGNMHNLPAFGYKIIIVDWLYPNQDIRMNALRFSHLLNHYICHANNDEQFVVIGHSMGCLIARYTLTAMETFWANDCHPEKEHNTRLFISNDGPHQGVNIPMSVQRLLGDALGVDGYLRGLTDFMDVVTFHQVDFTSTLLEGTSVKQMLNRHYSTGLDEDYYTPANEYLEFFSDLESIGNYPSHCKLVALSNGSMEGEGQQNIYYDEDEDTYYGYTSDFRTPNDQIFHMYNNLCFRVLGFTFGTDLEIDLRSNPEDCGNLFNISFRTYKPQLSLYWFGIRVESVYEGDPYIRDGCGLRPYCISPGGHEYVKRRKRIMKSPWGIFANLGFLGINLYFEPGSSFAMYNYVGIPWILDISNELYMHTDGLGFGFVPIGSAFDYDNREDLNINYTTLPPSEVMSHTPFDVLIGRVKSDSQAASNGNHEDVINPPLLENNSVIRYSFCDEMYKCLLNSEIGDDELYLECNHIFWNSKFSAYKTIHHNQYAPYYSYSNCVADASIELTQQHPTVGAISELKDDISCHSCDIQEYCNYPEDYDYYAGEYHGVLCCVNHQPLYSPQKRDKGPNSKDILDNDCSHTTPNISTQNSTIEITCPNNDIWSINIYSLYGNLLLNEDFNGHKKNVQIPKNWENGIYIVTISSQNGIHYSTKIII